MVVVPDFMPDIRLLPPNLATLGVKRQAKPGQADLTTIWRTPYPVLTNYSTLCNQTDLLRFAGGSYEHQGSDRCPGFILSGYRDQVIEGNESSPHLFAFAIDVLVGNATRQLFIAKQALTLFTRVGLYPFRGFVHLDLASADWIAHYHKRRFWVQDQDRKYHSFDGFDQMIESVKVMCGL